MKPDFSRFPQAGIARLPTPVAPLAKIGEAAPKVKLFMKRDDLAGAEYGGNKIRKLDFLLGDALAQGRRSVVTYGAAGSNHALATAVCCRRLGLKAISILAPQRPDAHVRRNLLMQCAAGAEMHLCAGYEDFPAATRTIADRRQALDGIAPYAIPAGGSNATGALGFVQAAFEMAEQIRPDVVYVPMGTGGTLAGLLAGFRMAGLHTRIEAVRVVDPAFRNEGHVATLCGELCAALGAAPLVPAGTIAIRDEFLGGGYGIPTPEAEEAVALFRDAEHLRMETTYTGKTIAALLHDLRAGRLDGQVVLYWNTLNSRDFSAGIAGLGVQDLPPAFRPYFV